mgnify:CR=1 FL=1
MSRIALLFNTIRYLKWQQIYYRLYYRIRKPKIGHIDNPVLRGCFSGWHGEAFLKPATSDGVCFTFLGESAVLHNEWNSSQFSKLWLYNLHYQDDLNAAGAENFSELHVDLIERWINANPPLSGNGWEPYCLSLRLVNWVKWFARQPDSALKEKWLHSMAVQTKVLEQRLEYHVQGNHLFANAKALVFVGCYLGGKQGDHWLSKGLNLLDREVVKQFLPDGAHFELSPMYHATLLWDMCDLIQLQQQTRLPCLCEREHLWCGVVVKGIKWLRCMVHPDGDLAFFNDTTFGISPTLKQLEGYAGKLACLPEHSKKNTSNLPSISHLEDSGYITLDWNEDCRAIIDAAQVGPDYQPGHAHADTLSFELSLFGQRVFVNSGISQYGEDAVRHYQRSTAAHNTVEVDGKNSSEVWAGFRVARRARPFDIKVEGSSYRVCISASHDGYLRLPGKVLTKRELLLEKGVIQVIDELSGKWSKAVSRFYCHPDISVNQFNKNEVLLTLPQGQVVCFRAEGASELHVVERSWHPAFGLSTSNSCIEAVFSGAKLVSRIDYQNLC